MKKSSLLLTLFIICSYTFAQEKPPECTPDWITITAGDTVEVNVLANDWCMQGHTMEILFVASGTGGIIIWADSIVRYESYYYSAIIDSVKYRIKDITNGLLSEDSYLIVSFINKGFSYLDINNIRALIQADGFQFCDQSSYTSIFEVPKGSGISSVYNATLWMGGLDGANNIHLAAESYRQIGTDFYPGPFSSVYEPGFIPDWYKLWNITREEIEYHKTHWNETGYMLPEAIANWPASGNTSLGQAEQLAPYADVNENGTYDPASGDYPVIRGDKNIFFINNENILPHTETGGASIGADILGQAYAFDCTEDSIFNNSIFFHYDVLNRSGINYHDFYLGSFVDLDLGYAWDDFIGCDTMLQMFFVFNGDYFDDISNIFDEHGYGFHPPAQGVVILNHKLNSFVGPITSGGIYGSPNGAVEYFNFLQGKWRDGSPILFQEDTIRFLYPGDPGDPEVFNEISAGNAPGDRKGVGAIGPINFNSGDTVSLDLAFVFTRDYEGTPLTSLALLKERVAQLQWYYDNDSTPCGSHWSAIKESKVQNLFSIYPNPAVDFVCIKSLTQKPAHYTICDVSGRQVLEGTAFEQRLAISVGDLIPGIYFLTLTSEKNSQTIKFIKR